MKKVNYVFLIFFAYSLISCFNYIKVTDPEKLSNKPDLNASYIYGNFQVNEYSYLTNFRIALGLKKIDESNSKDENAKRYYIEFYPSEDSAYMIKIIPGKYIIESICFNLGSQIHKENKLNPKIIDFEKNKIYYIGDWEGRVTSNTWKLSGVKDNFNPTSEIILKKYPEFKEVEKLNYFNQK